jgi:hypothetical protein
MIGTDFTGNFAVPNGAHGIIFDGPAFGNVIGPNNVISGNTQNGIEMAPAPFRCQLHHGQPDRPFRHAVDRQHRQRVVGDRCEHQA